jgi:hypothetical protein
LDLTPGGLETCQLRDDGMLAEAIDEFRRIAEDATDPVAGTAQYRAAFCGYLVRTLSGFRTQGNHFYRHAQRKSLNEALVGLTSYLKVWILGLYVYPKG